MIYCREWNFFQRFDYNIVQKLEMILEKNTSQNLPMFGGNFVKIKELLSPLWLIPAK